MPTTRYFGPTLNPTFYDGLLFLERRMLDAASGGAIISKTLREIRELTSNLASGPNPLLDVLMR